MAGSGIHQKEFVIHCFSKENTPGVEFLSDAVCHDRTLVVQPTRAQLKTSVGSQKSIAMQQSFEYLIDHFHNTLW